MKKVYRSNSDRMIGGVLGGFAEYMNVDATILRVLFVIFSIVFAGFPGLIVYIACLLIIPKAPVDGASQGFNNQGNWYNPQTGRYEGGYNQNYNRNPPHNGQYTGQFNQNGGAQFNQPPVQENQDKPQSGE